MDSLVRKGLTVFLFLVTFASSACLAQEGDEPSYPAGWSELDIAFKTAMNEDLSFGVGEGRTQPSAIKAWEDFLSLEGISQEHKLFALWRIASMCSYNLDPVVRKEEPDEKRGEALFLQVRDLIPGLVCKETVNAATQHASQRGDDLVRAQRKAENYRWFRTRTTQMIQESAARVSAFGSIIGEDFTGQASAAVQVPLEKRRELVEGLVKEGEENIVRQISEFIEWSTDEVAVKFLLNAVEDVADPAIMQRWRNISGRFESEWESRTVGNDLMDSLDAVRAVSDSTGQPEPSTEIGAAQADSTVSPRGGDAAVSGGVARSRWEIAGFVVAVALLVGIVYGVLRCRKAPSR